MVYTYEFVSTCEYLQLIVLAEIKYGVACVSNIIDTNTSGLTSGLQRHIMALI